MGFGGRDIGSQPVPPQKSYALMQEAVSKGAAEYVIINVSNVREFVLGIDATAKMTWRRDCVCNNSKKTLQLQGIAKRPDKGVFFRLHL
jgi:hypothetical protein